MPLELDHAIVPSRDRAAAARLLASLLDVPWAAQGPVGPFSPVYVTDVIGTGTAMGSGMSMGTRMSALNKVA